MVQHWQKHPKQRLALDSIQVWLCTCPTGTCGGDFNGQKDCCVASCCGNNCNTQFGQEQGQLWLTDWDWLLLWVCCACRVSVSTTLTVQNTLEIGSVYFFPLSTKEGVVWCEEFIFWHNVSGDATYMHVHVNDDAEVAYCAALHHENSHWTAFLWYFQVFWTPRLFTKV